MGHKSVPMILIPNPIGLVGPAGNCLDLYPENSGFRNIQKSGFFESCKARYGLSIRTYDTKMIFGGNILDRHHQRKIGGPILKRRRSIKGLTVVCSTYDFDAILYLDIIFL